MPKTKSCRNNTSGSYDTRLAAAQSFTQGARIRHKITGKQGVFQEINLGFALPEVWVQFESDSEISVPVSCNPLELELANSESKEQEEIPSVPELSEFEDAPVAAVEVLEELTQDEERERHRLELRVERGFREAVAALRQLRDKRLYRSTHRTFEEYCKDRFGYNRSRSYQLLDAAIVVDNLKECPQFVDILPTNESQCRSLIGFVPEHQRIIWGALVEQGLRPTGTSLKNKARELEEKGIVERLKEKPLVLAQDFCKSGDVFFLKGLVEEERKYNGCWAIAADQPGINVKVDVHDTTLFVKPENLKPIDSPDVRRQLPQILKRIRRLRDCGMLDRCAYTVLESLGRQTYLTDLEEKMLSYLEEYYRAHGVTTRLESLLN